MPLQFYNANKSNSGGGLGVSFNSKDQSVYLSLIRQNGWNAAKNVGIFKDGAKLNFKLSLDEASGIINAINTRSIQKFYHSFKDKTTSGQFSYYEIPPKDGKDGRSGFGISLKQGEEVFKVGLSVGGAENLKQYLIFALNHCYNQIYSNDKKANEEYQKTKNAKTESSTPEQDAEPATETSGGEDELF